MSFVREPLKLTFKASLDKIKEKNLFLDIRKEQE
jgi:hypothetical protein